MKKQKINNEIFRARLGYLFFRADFIL